MINLWVHSQAGWCTSHGLHENENALWEIAFDNSRDRRSSGPPTRLPGCWVSLIHEPHNTTPRMVATKTIQAVVRLFQLISHGNHYIRPRKAHRSLYNENDRLLHLFSSACYWFCSFSFSSTRYHYRCLLVKNTARPIFGENPGLAMVERHLFFNLSI